MHHQHSLESIHPLVNFTCIHIVTAILKCHSSINFTIFHTLRLQKLDHRWFYGALYQWNGNVKCVAVLSIRWKWEKFHIAYISHLFQCYQHHFWGKLKLTLIFSFPFYNMFSIIIKLWWIQIATFSFVSELAMCELPQKKSNFKLFSLLF
jgi:hypothetical protein